MKKLLLVAAALSCLSAFAFAQETPASDSAPASVAQSSTETPDAGQVQNTDVSASTATESTVEAAPGADSGDAPAEGTPPSVPTPAPTPTTDTTLVDAKKPDEEAPPVSDADREASNVSDMNRFVAAEPAHALEVHGYLTAALTEAGHLPAAAADPTHPAHEALHEAERRLVEMGFQLEGEIFNLLNRVHALL